MGLKRKSVMCILNTKKKKQYLLVDFLRGLNLEVEKDEEGQVALLLLTKRSRHRPRSGIEDKARQGNE